MEMTLDELEQKLKRMNDPRVLQAVLAREAREEARELIRARIEQLVSKQSQLPSRASEPATTPLPPKKLRLVGLLSYNAPGIKMVTGDVQEFPAEKAKELLRTRWFEEVV